MDVTRIVPGTAYPATIGGTTGETAPTKQKPFGEVLKDSLKQVNTLQHEADKAIQDLATGGPTTLHDTMLTIEKAELSFKLMMQVRNKIVEAYQEVLRMQV